MSKIKIDVWDEDCIHCYLWAAIHQYVATHPDGCVQDVVEGLAEVLGDQLADELSHPHVENFKRIFSKRLDARIAFKNKARAH